jgi:hypothetical protein
MLRLSQWYEQITQNVDTSACAALFRYSAVPAANNIKSGEKEKMGRIYHNKLTESALRGMKSDGRLQFFVDGEGLNAILSIKGNRISWYQRYQLDGKERGFTFGQWPLVSLAEARAARDAMRKMIAAGIDPAQRRSDVLRAIRLYREGINSTIGNIARAAAQQAVDAYTAGQSQGATI